MAVRHTFLTALLVAVFGVSGFETKYAILIRRTTRLIAPDIAPLSLAWGRDLLFHRKSISVVAIEHSPDECCLPTVISRFDVERMKSAAVARVLVRMPDE